MLCKFFGMSESSPATSRRRSCLASNDGELRLESVKVDEYQCHADKLSQTIAV